jgi:hypothetical protein
MAPEFESENRTARPHIAELHQRGRHVQHAHGRRSAVFDASGSHLSGGMIALMPTVEDAKRLAMRGGEKAADLHLTLFFIGDDVSGWDDNSRGEMIGILTALAALQIDGPITANVFGIAHWNGGGDSASWVWNVGDKPDGSSDPLIRAKSIAVEALESTHYHPDVPQQHTPWAAYICAAYTDDLTLSKELEKRLGPVTFDRIRVSFGDEDHDIPLGPESASLTAGGVMHRLPTDIETSSRIDFAMVDKQWKSAVTGMMGDYVRIEADQRSELRQQITEAMDADHPGYLTELAVSTDDTERLLIKHMRRLADLAGKEMQREAEHQGVKVPAWDLDTVLASSALDVLTSVSKLTAKNLGLGMVRSATSKVMSLIGLNKSGREVAGTVDDSLKALSDAGPREAIGAAMSAAQNAGRMAVLTVAPSASYYASEALDKNTCKPCTDIDGTEFTTLTDAKDAYPSGGYAGCAGGPRCRGTMIAVWGGGQSASAAVQEEGMSTVTEDLGGKPNPGTKKDKRKKVNQYAYDGCENCSDTTEHFLFGETVTAAWDGSTSKFTDDEYKRATAACDAGPEPVKTRCFLPHHDPGGALNEDGLAAAAGRSNQLSGRDPAAVARAKSHLRGHYRSTGKPVPDNLKATDDEVAAFALEDGYDTITWGAAMAAQDCPPNMELDPATGECGAIKSPNASAKTAGWNGPLLPEGKATGDGREFAPGALDWPEDIAPGEMALRWNKEDSHGGEPHTVAVNVGRIDKVWRENGLIMASGVFDLGHPDGVEAHRRVGEGFLRGISIDADDISNADIEFVWPENASDGTDEGDIFEMLFAQPEKVVYHGGRIRAATLCDIPAFVEAYIALTDDEGAVVAAGQTHPELVQDQGDRKRTLDGLTVSLTAHGGPTWKPPAEWFANPQLSMPVGIQITDEGRVYGHAAQWGSCHIGQTGTCVQPPREDEHPYFMTGEMSTNDGTPVAVGQITVHTGHPSTSMKAQPAAEHYDNTGYAVADVTVGNDSHGIWVAGAIRANADPLLVHELRASGQVSGDWRRIGGKLRLVGLLGVNVPGFPVPKMQARVASGELQSLIAAGQLTVSHGLSEDEVRAQAYKIVMDDLFRQITEGSE